MKAPFIWDPYSDQPYPIKDKDYKRKMRKKHIFAVIPLLLLNIVFFPLSILLMLFSRSQDIDTKDFYGMGVDLDKGEEQIGLIRELGINYVLVRMPLWEMHRIDEYVSFVKRFFDEDINILLNILQDREHIEDSVLLQNDITTIFETFSPYVNEYQLGNVINRTKWGFFSMDEYLGWYAHIQKIRDGRYPQLKLVGSSVIDFEFHYTIRTLFNFFKVKYDVFSSLLYVDRRGSPNNTQMGIFDTKNKINMLYALVRLSKKTSNKIYITEVNWPLSNTAPYAPTSEVECVSEALYAQYMAEYLHIAKESGKIQRVYWHQLIAPGYGLIDNRGNVLRKREAYELFKKIVNDAEDQKIL